LNQYQLCISDGERALLVYRYGDVAFKPYVEQLFSWDGRNVVRDNVPDHIHHHGLMFALQVDDTTFWGEDEKAGKQIHQSFEKMEVNHEQARFSQRLQWHNPEGKILLHEKRTLTLRPEPDQQAVILQWRSQCRPAGKTVVLTGSHYYGLGMRFSESMDAIGRFSNSANAEGQIFRGEERLVDAEWCAYSIPGDIPLSITMYDHPSNPRPATWFTMAEPFAYLSATMRYHEEKMTLKQNESLDLRYRVVVRGSQP